MSFTPWKCLFKAVLSAHGEFKQESSSFSSSFWKHMGFAQEGIPVTCSTESTTNLPTPHLPREAGHLQTLNAGGHWAGPPQPWWGCSSEGSPRHILQDARPPAAPRPGWGMGERGENPSVPRYLELLLSSVIVEHQLFLLLAANDGLSSWSSLAPLKWQGDSALWVKAFYGWPGRVQLTS